MLEAEDTYSNEVEDDNTRAGALAVESKDDCAMTSVLILPDLFSRIKKISASMHFSLTSIADGLLLNPPVIYFDLV
jgi:hypothetical protein